LARRKPDDRAAHRRPGAREEARAALRHDRALQADERLTFVGTELHKAFSPRFNAATPEDYKPVIKERLMGRLRWVNEQLEGPQYVMGENFTVADCYLFVFTGWAKPVGMDLGGFANITAWRERVAARPAVQAAMGAEGLVG
jgi:glutathione S-transferase